MTKTRRDFFSTIADGKGVKVESPVGVDYVFLSDEPFDYNEGDVAFEGLVGTIQLRKGKPVLSLGAKGRIAVGKDELNR